MRSTSVKYCVCVSAHPIPITTSQSRPTWSLSHLPEGAEHEAEAVVDMGLHRQRQLYHAASHGDERTVRSLLETPGQVDVNCVPRISGCNFSAATNFDSVATIYEEGSCTFAVGGCTDQGALNFLDVATVDDGGAPG